MFYLSIFYDLDYTFILLDFQWLDDKLGSLSKLHFNFEEEAKTRFAFHSHWSYI